MHYVNFARRAAALDLLETRGAQATVLSSWLEAANERVLWRLRERITAGRYTPGGLRRAFARVTGPPPPPGRRGDGYDALDLLTAGLLGGADALPPEPRLALEAEMVHYQPTPARAVLELIDRAGIGPGDVLCDLGSGLGQVAILVALLTGARARGIEREPAYCEHARRSARLLNLPGVEIVQADVRDAPLAGGTVYFLYTPVRGAMLQQVLERLRAEAAAATITPTTATTTETPNRRPIRVCTYGPCTREVAGAAWLTLASPADPRDLSEREIAVFRYMPVG